MHATRSGDTAASNRSCCRPTVDGFQHPGSKTDDPKKTPPKTHPNRTPKRTVFGPQKPKRTHKSPSAPASADLIPSREAVRTGQPPGKPMRCGWVCPGVGALRFHRPRPPPPEEHQPEPSGASWGGLWAAGVGPPGLKPSAHTTADSPDLVSSYPAGWQGAMSVLEGFTQNLDGAGVDPVSSLANLGSKRGRFGTSQRDPLCDMWPSGGGTVRAHSAIF